MIGGAGRRRRRRQRAFTLAAGVAALILITAVATTRSSWWSRPDVVPRPLLQVGLVRLPGTSSRFDYAELDPGTHRLWIAHLGDDVVDEVDTAAAAVVRTVSDLAGATGVIVVPALHRVFVSTPGTAEVAALDEDTGTVLARTPAGSYPDGLAYVPSTGQVWVSDQSGGVETVLDGASGARVATVELGGEAGNVRYDAAGDRVLVDVQTRDEVVAIDPRTRTVQARVRLPGCDHDHSLALDRDRAYVACDGNDTLFVLNLADLTVMGTLTVGHQPDVLAVDPVRQLLYVAAESGVLTIIDTARPGGRVLSRDRVGENAHVVALDPATGATYYPLSTGPDGVPELLVMGPNSASAHRP